MIETGSNNLAEELLANLFSMNDTKYPNLFTHNLKDDPIISDSQLPIAVECFAQWFTIEMRSRQS
jgi:hypothetical protein